MNTANVMAISPKPGTPNKIQPARTASKAGGDTVSQEKDSFGEVLGRAGEDVTGKVPQSPTKAQQGSDKAETGADKNNVNAEAKSVNDIAADVKENLSEEIPETVKNMAGQAALLNFTAEGKTQLVAEIEPEAAAKVDLQSLIPQSAETMQKNKTFLAMLSGQQIQPVADGNTKEQALNVDSLQTQLWGQAQNKQPVTVLEVQLNNHQLANQLEEQLPPLSEEPQQPIFKGDSVALQVKETPTLVQSDVNTVNMLDGGKDTLFNAKGMALPEQSEQTMPSMPVGGVNKPAELQDNLSRTIAPAAVTPPPQKEEAQSSNPLAGVNVVVEEDVPPVMPGMEARQFANQQNGQRQQAPQQEIITDEGEAVTQLAEEAVGDKAPVRSSQTAQQSPASEPVSMFQQSLNDSIRGLDRPADVQDIRAPQDDFNVPRQIIEQARLLRRGEDTQMVIKLNPEHLGELTLKVSVSANGAVNASFHSDNAQVRAIIENTLVQLKQELNNQGLKVDNVDVYAGLGDGQLPQGEGQQAWQQNQGQHGTGTGNVASIGGVEEYGEDTAVTAAAAAESQAAAEGVDYRI